MRAEVTYLSGEVEEVFVTSSADLAYERAHKEPFDTAYKAGLHAPLYEVLHHSVKQGQPDTPDHDEWLATVREVVVIPDSAASTFAWIVKDEKPEMIEQIAVYLMGLAESKRAEQAPPEIPATETPTGGDSTQQQVDSPSPSSGPDSIPTD